MSSLHFFNFIKHFFRRFTLVIASKRSKLYCKKSISLERCLIFFCAFYDFSFITLWIEHIHLSRCSYNATLNWSQPCLIRTLLCFLQTHNFISHTTFKLSGVKALFLISTFLLHEEYEFSAIVRSNSITSLQHLNFITASQIFVGLGK